MYYFAQLHVFVFVLQLYKNLCLLWKIMKKEK